LFVGHTAVALAAKKAAPEVSLGWLVAAATWLDLVWPVFLLLGIESVEIDPGNTALTPLAFVYYPWTHSLVMVLVWSVAAAALGVVAFGRRRTGLLLGALVLSHWVLDLVVHTADLPLWPGVSPKYGLGLWNSFAGTLVVEGGLLLAGLWLYLRTTRARNAAGRYVFWSFVGLQVVIWIANFVSPPPPDERTLALFGLAGWLLPVWAWWADRNRDVVSPR
jgi:hypothetical protein